MPYNQRVRTTMDSKGTNGNQLHYIIWYIRQFPSALLPINSSIFTPNTAVNENDNNKNKEKNMERERERKIVIILGRCAVGVLGIHWHVLIVCELVKPFECLFRKKQRKKRKNNRRDGRTNDRRNKSREIESNVPEKGKNRTNYEMSNKFAYPIEKRHARNSK